MNRLAIQRRYAKSLGMVVMKSTHDELSGMRKGDKKNIKGVEVECINATFFSQQYMLDGEKKTTGDMETVQWINILAKRKAPGG